jgi:glycosyltransferase involved in cell wall biosynthesis
MSELVSVVVPTYNYGRYLTGALASVLGQTHPHLEVLVVDDGSTDDTPEVVAPFLADRRVRYFRRPNGGPAAARNFGVAQARGPLVAFLDADDRWLPAKLAKQLACFQAMAAPGLVYARRLLIDAEGWQLEYRQPQLYRGWVLPRLFRDNFICFSSVVVRRELLLAAGGFDTGVEHAEDYDLLLRLAQRAWVDFVDEPLVLYRTGHGNLSSQHEKRFRAVCAIMQRFLAGTGRGQLPAELVRRSWAETFCHWGAARRDHAFCGAALMFARALCRRPAYTEAWRGLASLCVPEPLRRRLRRWRGKPEDWRRPQRLRLLAPC